MRIKLVFLAVLISSLFSFTGLSISDTAYAAGECPNGFTFNAANNTCSKSVPSGSTETCPQGYVDAGSTSSAAAGQLICKEDLSATSGSESNPALQEDLLKRIKFIASIQSFLNTLIWPILVMIGGLLDNSMLFSGGMEERLRDIWIPIRNLVNIIFVILLVGIAIYNVLGIGEEGSEYSIKAVLPKIIIGLIAINFSFLGIKVMLDGINVLTTAVFSLPNQVGEGLDVVHDENNPRHQQLATALCSNIRNLTTSEIKKLTGAQITALDEDATYKQLKSAYNLTSSTTADLKTEIAAKDATSRQEIENKKQRIESDNICVGSELSNTGKAFLSSFNSRNAAFAMALNMGEIVFYPNIDLNIKSLDQLLINTIFSMVLYVVYLVSFIAMFLVLLARMVILWLSIAMSPLLLLMIASPTVKEKVGSLGELSDKFVKNAIAPLIMAVAMSVGWIMLNALKSVNDNQSKIFSVGLNNGIPVLGLSNLQDLIVSLGTVGVVWIGVFAAAEGTLAEKVTGFIKEKVEDAGKYLATTPLKHASIIPISIPDGSGGTTTETFNAGEVLNATEEMFRDNPQRRLSNILGLNSNKVDPDDYRKVKSEDDLSQLIATGFREDQFKDTKGKDTKQLIEGLEYVFNNNRQAFNDLDQKTNQGLSAILKAKDNPEELKTALVALRNQPAIVDKIQELDKKGGKEKPKDKGAQTGPKPEQSATTSNVQTIDKAKQDSTKFTPAKETTAQTVQEILSAAANPENEINVYNQSISSLEKVLNDPASDENAVKQALEKVKLNGKAPSAEYLKTEVLKGDLYAKLNDKLGNEDAIKTILGDK